MIQQPYFWVNSQGNKNLSQKDISTLTFTAALFTIAKIWKKLKCVLTDEWIKNMAYMYNKILFSFTYKRRKSSRLQ